MRTTTLTMTLAAGLLSMSALDIHAQTTAPPAMPRVCPFNINSGATVTNSVWVTLNCDTSTTSATEYRASELQDLSNALWRPLQSAIPFQLSSNDGMKTVYFQLRNARDTRTGIVSKSIVLQTRKNFTFNSRDAQLFASTQGFSFSAIKGDATSDCLITGEQTVNIDVIATGKSLAGVSLAGARCGFILFGGRVLKAGWVFKTYTADGSLCAPPGRGYTMVQRPISGGDLTFKISSWAEGLNTCQFILQKITLEGPATSTDWKDAFR